MKFVLTIRMSRSSHQLTEGLLELPIPQQPWSHISVDFLTNLTSSQGFTTVMVTIDQFSKACKLVSRKGLPTALETAITLFHHVFRNYGLPDDLVSDWGPQFTSRVWWAFYAKLGINVSLSLSYHPQSNGQTERLNQEIGWFLCSAEFELLPWAEYAQNSLTHSSTSLTPFQCVLGYQPPLFPWSDESSNIPAVDDWARRSQEVWERAHVRLQRAVHQQRLQANRHRRQHPAYQNQNYVLIRIHKGVAHSVAISLIRYHYIGEGNTGDEEVTGKFVVKERNLEGQMIVDFAKRMDMAVVNTYKSGEEVVKDRDREENQVVEDEKGGML
ncbi:hypothetical protein QTP70_009154 [Hemibagrus guttatus]|uniref:Integrase catalytic domain-containing protein n=1 Tax=Hemibagrus guttatus TaxID=175788 RepID=A0AAE0PYD5_9TELE|nr:hypothetical protein QTP70_009154 [Hemibagrus guttatus]